ncbi:GNAT family N-acetyltransferase [bacterium]|nr:GNAT family N-acetyltransferase [bacterium]
MYKIREYDPQKDNKAVCRIWREVNWIEEDGQEKYLDIFLSEGRGLVAEYEGSAECHVSSKSGVLRYLKEDLKLSIVSSVTTSRTARKQGLAKKLTAKLIAADAEAGALVSTLGIFEQGFYNLFGYGTGPYEHWLTFDPADIINKQKVRPPKRLTKDDWQIIHTSMLNRHRRHGAVSILPACFVQSDIAWSKDGFGLGYTDGEQGELTHFFWATNKGEYGPTTIHFMAYQNMQQFNELMAVIKTLGDQIRLLKMREPAGIQIQDLIRNPFRKRIVSEKSKFEHLNRGTAYWQMRICDLAACIAATHLNSKQIKFNLELSDPIEDLLDTDSKWRGCSGKYTITLGPESYAKQGYEEGLALLSTDIGAFTRLWMGVRPASGLSATENFVGPTDLLEELDEVLCLPDPHPDWDY